MADAVEHDRTKNAVVVKEEVSFAFVAIVGKIMSNGDITCFIFYLFELIKPEDSQRKISNRLKHKWVSYNGSKRADERPPPNKQYVAKVSACNL